MFPSAHSTYIMSIFSALMSCPLVFTVTSNVQYAHWLERSWCRTVRYSSFSFPSVIRFWVSPLFVILKDHICAAARCVLRDVERDVCAAKGIGGSHPDALSADEELDVGIGRGICGGDVSCQSHTIALYLDVGSQCLEEEIADVGCAPVVG